MRMRPSWPPTTAARRRSTAAGGPVRSLRTGCSSCAQTHPRRQRSRECCGRNGSVRDCHLKPPCRIRQRQQDFHGVVGHRDGALVGAFDQARLFEPRDVGVHVGVVAFGRLRQRIDAARSHAAQRVEQVGRRRRQLGEQRAGGLEAQVEVRRVAAAGSAQLLARRTHLVALRSTSMMALMCHVLRDRALRRFSMQSYPERTCDLENGGEARIPVGTESAIETLAAEPRIPCDLGHSFARAMSPSARALPAASAGASSSQAST